MKTTKEQNIKIPNTNKGITLIALVITIIVMLILVAVTISMAVNGRLFNYAGKATGETQNVINAEQQLAEGRIYVSGVWYDSAKDYVDKVPSTEQEKANHSWERNGDVFSCKCDNCIEGNEEGMSFVMGQKVYYVDKGIGESSLDGEKSGVLQGISDGKLVDTDYGENGLQTIKKDSNTTWVVLGIEDCNNDEIFETLLLTTETPTTETLTLYGINPYNYKVDEELNRMCKEIYGENARCINPDDVCNALDFTPQGGMYYPNSTIRNIFRIRKLHHKSK